MFAGKEVEMKFSTKVKSILYGMEFTHGMRRKLMGSLALVYFIYLGFNLVAITTLFAISTIIMTFFEFPTGAIADYDSRKKSILIGFFIMSLAFFGVFLFKNFWLLAGSWILGDIAWTFCSGSGSAWAIDALSIGKKKSKLVSLVSKGYIFEKSGHILGGVIGLVIVAINFSLIWLFVSVSNLFMFFVIAIYMEEKNFKSEKTPHNYLMKSLIKAKETFNYLIHKKNKELRVLFIAAFLGIFSTSAFSIGVPLLFTQILNLKEQYLPGIYAGLTVLALGVPLVIEKIIHKKGFRIPLVGLVFLVGISIILFAFSQSLIFAIFALALFTIGEIGLSVAQDSAYQHEFDSKIRASLGSIGTINWAIAFSTSVFLAGISITFVGLIPTIVVSGGVSLISALVYLFGMKK